MPSKIIFDLNDKPDQLGLQILMTYDQSFWKNAETLT